MKPQNVLILPGWQNSGPGHWQSLWEAQYGYHRVDQHDWMNPRRGDWMAQLEETILAADEPVVLVAHSLGCILTAAWAAHSKNTHRVKGALLVAPGDAERDELRSVLPSWSPVPMNRLPFPSLLVGSRNDPLLQLPAGAGDGSVLGLHIHRSGQRRAHQRRNRAGRLEGRPRHPALPH